MSLSSGLSEFSLDADTCGDVVVDALHRDAGIENGASLEVTHKALYTPVNLQTHQEE